MSVKKLVTFCILSLIGIQTSHSEEQANQHHQHAADVEQTADSTVRDPSFAGRSPALHDHSSHDVTAGEHTHHQHGAGMWMFDYRYVRMSMNGSKIGIENVDSGMIMGMDMHMFMSMYSLTSNVTFMVMAHYMRNTMEMPLMDMDMHSMNSGSTGGSMPTGGGHQHGKVNARDAAHSTGGTANTMNAASAMNDAKEYYYSYGPGDTFVSAMYKIIDPLTASFGVYLPTGGIEYKTGKTNSDGTPEYQPYAMQLGSGTYDLVPSLSYEDRLGSIGLGIDTSFTYRLGMNKRGYMLGNRSDSSAWLKYQVTTGVTLSSRLAYHYWGRVTRDSDKSSSVTQGAMDNPDSEGGTRLDAFVGISGMSTKNLMFSMEIGAPIYQNLYYGLDSMGNPYPQMKTTMLMAGSIQYMF